MSKRLCTASSILAAAVASACAHGSASHPTLSAEFACDRAEFEVTNNAVEATWGRLDDTPLSPLSYVSQDRSRSAWKSNPRNPRETYWTNQCRAALERERSAP